MVTMKSIKYQFGLLIFAYLFLVGCGDRADEGVTNEDMALQTESVNKELEMDSDYLLEKDSIGNGVFVSEHLSETEEFIGQLLIETVENKGNISEGKRQYFSNWAMEQLVRTHWGLLGDKWTANTDTYDRSYTLNYIYGDIGYEFSYCFLPNQQNNPSSEMQSVNVQAFVDSSGIIRSIDIKIFDGPEVTEGVAGTVETSGLFYDEFQELIIEEGMVYEGEIVYEQDGCGLLASGDAALSAEMIGEVLINVLESGGTKTEDYKDLFVCESAYRMFKNQKWDQLGTGWEANSYYDCYYIYIHEEDGYIEFLYYFYPDYDAMNAETAKALTFRCGVDIDNGKLDNTDLRIYSMTREEYQEAREWKGRRIAIIEDGEIAEGGGYIPIPVPENGEELRYIDTNNDMGEYRLCELLMEDFNTGNVEGGKISKFITDKEASWLSDIAGQIGANRDAGWQMGEKYDFYYLNHNEQTERIHYRYYFYWNKADEEREKVLAADAWISESGLENMEIHWFMSRRHFTNDMSQGSEEKILKEADIAPFLAFDWTTEQVLMGEHIIEPEDSARGWEFSIADIDFDDRQEMLISFPSNHCGGNSLYIYKQENGRVFSYADTIATPVYYMLTGIDYKKISPYMDIDLLDIYVNEDNEYRYLSLDRSSFGGDIHGGIYTVILYETALDHGGEPKEIARINYYAPEEKEELYFLGEKVYETGNLRELIASYMNGYTEVTVDYKTAEKTFARDVVAVSDDEKKQELDELYESLKKLTIDKIPFII